MLNDRLSKEYQDGVESFLKLALENATDPRKYIVLVKSVFNLQKLDVVEIRDNLNFSGINDTYETWIWHGKGIKLTSS